MLEKVDCSGWMGGWVDGWMGGWMGVKAGLRIAYSNQQVCISQNKIFNK